jgi:hypothetical protein
MQRGHWFPNSGDVSTFRNKINNICRPSDAELAANRKKKEYKLVIYQRDVSRYVIV